LAALAAFQKENPPMSTALSRFKLEDRVTILRRRADACGKADAGKKRLIMQALARIHDGTYGYCTHCGMQIPERDLERAPERPVCHRCEGREAA
jgi:RNA polymerase-binding transcription factor DksA